MNIFNMQAGDKIRFEGKLVKLTAIGKSFYYDQGAEYAVKRELFSENPFQKKITTGDIFVFVSDPFIVSDPDIEGGQGYYVIVRSSDEEDCNFYFLHQRFLEENFTRIYKKKTSSDPFSKTYDDDWTGMVVMARRRIGESIAPGDILKVVEHGGGESMTLRPLKTQSRLKPHDRINVEKKDVKISPIQNPDSPKKGVLHPGDYLEVLDEHNFHFTDFSSSHTGGDKVSGRGRNEHIVTMSEGDYVRYIGPIQAGEKTLYKFIYYPQDKPDETTFYVEDARKLLKGIGY